MHYPRLLAGIAALIGVAGTAGAHPKLLSASPAPNATVSKPVRLELHFSEPLMASFSKASLMMAMPGHAPMKIASATAAGSDGRTLVLTPRRPLGPGRYRVDWHAVSVDTHHLSGNYAFAVK
ncbi:MAG: copper homeostasis periplasmic binding protein CopC [Sphingomicrobium sp.]|nr:copper homeostasis periplasmic binding protein CopC [Sphingomonadales bacterium]